MAGNNDETKKSAGEQQEPRMAGNNDETKKSAGEQQEPRMAETSDATKKSAVEQQEPKMAETSAPNRMKTSQQIASMFFPKLMFFLTSSTKDEKKNWADCFDMKAGAVYFTICGQNANANTLDDARNLLKAIAYFITRGKGPSEGTKTSVEPAKSTGTASSAAKEKVKTPEGPKTSTGKTTEELKAEIEKKLEDLTPENKLAIDAVYLVVGFLYDAKKNCLDINKNARNPISLDRENLDKYCLSKHGAHVLSDIAMLDNQLRLDCITKVVSSLPEALASIKNQWQSLFKDSFKLSFDGSLDISEVTSVFCRYYTPFNIDSKKFPSYKPKAPPSSEDKRTLLEWLHYCIVPAGTSNGSSTGVGPVLTAKELQRNGVRLGASTDQLFAVEFKSPALKLPVLLWDSKMETVVLNLVALESSRTTRPVTRYLQLLNELVEDEGDVRVLKRCGIFKGKWKRDEDVVNFFKRVDGFASYPSMYPNVDDAMDKVKKYIDERNNRFLVKYSWVPYVAAAATVIVTALVATKRRGR